MIVGFHQNWRTSCLPWSLSLANAVNTGVSFNTPNNAIANIHWWASRGFQGFGPRGFQGLGPRIQYSGAGMDGMCRCHCSGGLGQLDLASISTTTLALGLGAAAMGLYLIFGTTPGRKIYGQRRVAAAERKVERLKARYGV